MNTNCVAIRLKAIVMWVTATMVVVIAVAIVAFEPTIAWNSGTRESLSKSLRAISTELAAGRVDAADFVAVGASKQHGYTNKAKEYGQRLKWHYRGSHTEYLFLPVAMTPSIKIDNSTTEHLPQIVMMPVDAAELEPSSILNTCSETPESCLRECHLRAIGAAFRSRNIYDATTLMSDGSVVHIPVSKLLQPAERQ